MLVVLDNTVLSNFGCVNSPELVLDLWPGLACSTQGVLSEYHNAVITRGYRRDCWNALPVIELTPTEITIASHLPPRLGCGERECLAIAIRRQGRFASDDHIARMLARTHGIALSGSIGILLAHIQRGTLTLNQANSILKQMIAAGYRAPVDDLGTF